MPVSTHSLLMERRSLTSQDGPNMMQTRRPTRGYPGAFRLPHLTHRFVFLKYCPLTKAAEHGTTSVWKRYRLSGCHIRKFDNSNVGYLAHLTSLTEGHMVGAGLTLVVGDASGRHLSFVSLLYPYTLH